MGWFTDTASAPKIQLAYEGYKQPVQFSTDTSLAGKIRNVTVTTYEIVGLTRAVSDSAALRYNTEDSISARSVRMNDANGYKVEYTVRTVGAWRDDT